MRCTSGGRDVVKRFNFNTEKHGEKGCLTKKESRPEYRMYGVIRDLDVVHGTSFVHRLSLEPGVHRSFLLVLYLVQIRPFFHYLKGLSISQETFGSTSHSTRTVPVTVIISLLCYPTVTDCLVYHLRPHSVSLSTSELLSSSDSCPTSRVFGPT